MSLDDPKAIERFEQKEKLDKFVANWFENSDGTAAGAIHKFNEPSGFEELLETHLRKLFRKLLKERGIEVDSPRPVREAEPTWTVGSPFRGLDVFDAEHAPVFFGRTRATSEVINALRQQDAEGRAFVMVLGTSGCGKSSLVRAGVLPMLTNPGVIEGVGLWRQAIMRRSDSSGDIFDGLAAALVREGAIPELSADGTTPSQLAQQLRDDRKRVTCW